MAAPEPTNEDLRLWASELYITDDLDDECRAVLDKKSNLYSQPAFKEVFATCKKTGRDGSAFNKYVHLSPDMKRMTLSHDIPSDPRLQLTGFHNACMTVDFVAVDAMIRLGADTDSLSGRGETALPLACSMVMLDHLTNGRKTHPGRIRIIRRLLQVGVDPNIGCPLKHACAANALDVCEILLANGADPRIQAADGKLPKEHLAAPLRRRFLKLPKGKQPEPLCWCLTSGLPLKDCHGKKGGGEAEPSFGCFCKSGKTYERCCKKRGLTFRETRDNFAQVRSSPLGPDSPLPAMLEKMKAGKGPNDLLFPNTDAETINRSKKELSQMMLATLDIPKYDPAFAYALEHVDFTPKYWKYMLPRNECLLRQKEWNDSVDEYITSKRVEGDTRSEKEIEIAAKIGDDGASLYKECSNCHGREQREKEFKTCAQCEVRAYCGKDCQTLHWKEGGHQRNCKKETKHGEFCPIHLPSQISVGQVLNMMGELANDSLSGDDVDDIDCMEPDY